jgi:cysteinyl-tRNA synthetase
MTHNSKPRVYNTLTNRIETFKPIHEGKIGLYTCGPTVYDFAHIGNFRSYVFEDLIKRYLIYLGYGVRQVMNITDIDDKTIKKANEKGVSLNEVTAEYIAAFFEDIEKLNILKADVYPRATEHIEEMVQMIEKLEQNGYAYRKGNSVYFKIEKFADYGKLANITRENLVIGTQVDADEYDKEHVQDFVLWKGKKEGEPCWQTPYGEGRPGWHLECSAMSMKYLGQHFDIHMGGVDNIFPHHENEIAQSEGTTGEKFVNYWIHCQHLIVDNRKMSKSLGNYYTLRDLIDQGHDPMAIRYLLLSTHYRKLLNFTFEGLLQARQSLNRINDFLFSLKGIEATAGGSPEICDLIGKSEREFQESLNDDFNISGGLGVFFEFIHQINLRGHQLKQQDIRDILAYVDRIDSVLGVLKKEETAITDEEILKKIEKRQDARQKKDYATADAIRDELKEKGIILIDTPDGVRWKIEK